MHFLETNNSKKKKKQMDIAYMDTLLVLVWV